MPASLWRRRNWEADLVVAGGPPTCWPPRRPLLSLPLSIETLRHEATRENPIAPENLQVLHIPTRCEVIGGKPDVAQTPPM